MDVDEIELEITAEISRSLCIIGINGRFSSLKVNYYY